VRLTIRAGAADVSIEVANSGECDERTLTNSGGIGLANVRRRLALCYGEETRFETQVADGVTTIGFTLPLKPTPQVLASV
jgi:LytS/YehU family sensor histidine kinase